MAIGDRPVLTLINSSAIKRRSSAEQAEPEPGSASDLNSGMEVDLDHICHHNDAEMTRMTAEWGLQFENALRRFSLMDGYLLKFVALCVGQIYSNIITYSVDHE